MSQNWAICIGIDRYDNLQSLQYAKRDAEALRDFFDKDAGFERVYFFAEGAPPIPTDFGEPIHSAPSGGTLRRFLRVRFEQQFLKPSDNLWFFFAGHGRREHDRDYLMPMDADPGNVQETAILVSYVAERLRRSGAENVLLLLDACRNEGARDGQGVGADRQAGIVTICSCSPNERSYEITELQHGAFTFSLLEGLRPQGNSNCATIERLDQYLRFRVPELCQKYGKPRQTPYTHAEPIEKLHLVLLPWLASPSDLGPIKLDALQAEASGDMENAEQLWWRVIAVSPTDAQAHAAIKRIAQRQTAQAAAVPGTRSAAATEASSPAVEGAKAPTVARHSGLTRRRALGAAGLATATIGLAGGGFLVRRHLATPQLRSVSLDLITVDERGVRSQPQKFEVRVFTEALGYGGAFDMVSIPPGSFTMGSPPDEEDRQPNEDPQHRVTLASFFMSAAPVAQAQWAAVVLAHPDAIERLLPPAPAFFRGVDLPVESVTWNQAREFCLRLAAITGRAYRLPSEAEWEYACRAGTKDAFCYGPTITPELANYCGTGGAVCGNIEGKSIASDTYAGVRYRSGSYGQGPAGVFRGTTTRSGMFPPNRFGLFDMHGNVWEWCLDVASESYADVPLDGSPNYDGPSDGERVLRGGSWSHNPAICRAAYRDFQNRDSAGWPGRIGFRVVCTL